MARIRTIKPELPQDAKLARHSRGTRYHFVLLWLVADDEGYFRASPRLLLGQLYPHDRDLGEAAVDGMTAELAEARFIEIHVTIDGPVGRIRNWSKHQRIDRPSASHLAELFASPSRAPREPLAAVVLSLESLVLSPETAAAARELEVQPEPPAVPAPVARTYAQECTIAANTALGELLGGAYQPLVASVQAPTAEVWERDGVPLPIAISAVSAAVRRYKPSPTSKQPRTLRYFDPAVREAWEKSRATGAKPKPITDRPPPREPTPEEHLMHLDRLAAAQAERKRGNLSESVGAVLARAGVA